MVMMLLIPMVVWDYVFHTYDDDDVLWWWWNEEVGDLIPHTQDDYDVMAMIHMIYICICIW